MKIIYRLFQGISILPMLFFSIPKLIASPPSVEGLTQFSTVINIDPFCVYLLPRNCRNARNDTCFYCPILIVV